LPQEIQAAGVEVTDVFDAVFHHYQPVDASAPGKTGVDIGINTGLVQDIGVDQAAA
jgi:hypothetical protein